MASPADVTVRPGVLGSLPGRLTFARVILACLALALLLAAPSLGMGFFMDDHAHVVALEGRWVASPSSGDASADPLDMFRFAPGQPDKLGPLIARGPFPWWTLPTLKVAFFRPLSSMLMFIDHALFGRWAPGYHLHSILWYLAVVAAWGALLWYMVRRRLLPAAPAALALLLFAIDDAHLMPASWIATRHLLISTAFGLLALLAHLRWREERWRPGLPLSLAGLALALLAGEGAIGILAYLGAYELLGARGQLRRRLLALVPAGSLALVYVCVYKGLGYGASGCGSYFDPTTSSALYLSALPVRMIVMLGGLILGVPTDLWVVTPKAHLALVGAGLVGTALLLALLRTCWKGLDAAARRLMRWLLAGMILSLLPVAAAFPMDRLLMLPSLGSSLVFALVLHRLWQSLRRSGPVRRRRWLRTALSVALLVKIVVPLAAWPLHHLVLGSIQARARSSAAAAEIDDEQVKEQTVVVIQMRPVDSYFNLSRYVDQGRPVIWALRALSMAPHDHRLHRTGERRLELEVVGGRMLGTELERLARSAEHPLRLGQVVQLEGIRATVLAVDEQGPTRVRFDFDKPLDDPSLLFLVTWEGKLVRAAIPPVGGTISVPYPRGPLGS